MEHIGTKRLETDRLILRPFVPEDAVPMFRNWASDPEVTRYLTWPTHQSMTVTRSVIESWVKRYDDPAYYHWTIELKSLGEDLGFNWSDDSLQLVEGLMPYLALDEYKDKALQALQQQREGIAKSRQADFDRLLLDEFKTTTDSIANKMRSALTDPTEEILLNEAKKWYGQRQ